MDKLRKGIDELVNNTQRSSDIVYKFSSYKDLPDENKIRLYHQTTLPKIKQILKDGYLKGDVWSQEDIAKDDWRYGDYAIAFDIDKNKIHRANDIDRIIYENIPIDSFQFIKGQMARTPKGIENFKRELEK